MKFNTEINKHRNKQVRILINPSKKCRVLVSDLQQDSNHFFSSIAFKKWLGIGGTAVTASLVYFFL